MSEKLLRGVNTFVGALMEARESQADPPCANPQPTGWYADRRTLSVRYPDNHDPAGLCATCHKFHYVWCFNR